MCQCVSLGLTHGSFVNKMPLGNGSSILQSLLHPCFQEEHKNNNVFLTIPLLDFCSIVGWIYVFITDFYTYVKAIIEGCIRIEFQNLKKTHKLNCKKTRLKQMSNKKEEN